jgi:dipeptidyl aminopeptidase/acylaminoacyl peptidase
MPVEGTAHHPTITDMISLELPLQVRVSPKGRRVAYLVRTANWNENRYENQCYVYDLDQERSFQLTQSGSATQVEWLDDDSLIVAKAEENGEAQIWVFEHLIGEGIRMTDQKTGVQSFRPFAGGVVYLANDPERAEKKPRTDEFGTFTHFEQEESASALYYINFGRMRAYQKEVKRLTEDKAKEWVKPVLDLSKRLDEPLKVVDFVVSPLDDAIYLNCRSRDDLVFWEETSSYRLRLDPEKSLEEFINRECAKKDKPEKEEAAASSSAEIAEEEEDLSYLGELTQIALPKGAGIVGISPDGAKLLISHKARDNMFYTQPDLWILDLAAVKGHLGDEAVVNQLRNITNDLDQEVLHQEWVNRGVLVSYPSGTKTEIAQLSDSGHVDVIDLRGIAPLHHIHASKDGVLGFIGTNESTYPEVFVASPSLGAPGWSLRRLTTFGERIANWNLGTVETIRWPSKDGTEIEGVLRKPSNFDPNRKYPLLFVVHGGPAWFSAAYVLDIDDVNYYPSVQFGRRDILVLKPNYRGSIGRGQAFLELNKNNLGIGDLEDLEGAIEFLDAQGYLDPSRVGCMGWSQGGYISAFVGTHSDKFKAVSVGAGIADWYTYHITNDIPHFTTHYLSGSPFQNRDLYVKTAPISKIREARTPILIQHGAKDQRVPLANATELYRGLKAMGVPVELFVFPEMAHPITKPRENRAVMWQNLTWFCHYLLGEELDFFKENDEPSGAESST